jgi:hypothetical protein
MNGDYSQPVNLGNPEEYSVKVKAFLLKIMKITCENDSFYVL